MKANRNIFKRLNSVNRYRARTIATIALLWTIIDVVVILLFNTLPSKKLTAILIREIFVFVSSIGISYLLVVELRRLFRNYNLLTALLIKSLILISTAFLMNLVLYSFNSISVLGINLKDSFHQFYTDTVDISKLLRKILYWLVLFLITQLLIELNEKYSPGVFMDILLGKYVEPKVETRIVMFMDLKDSTPIAEKLGSQQYFSFIREFIYQVSNALIEYGGRIYQYVGDEIVVSWLYNKENMYKSVRALIQARRNLNRQHTDFQKRFGVIPDFRVGVHLGIVTVGEIGVIKKDLAMSGDTMNTAARIRSYCSELDHRYIASNDFVQNAKLTKSQIEDLGMVELKGKTKELQLFALKI